MQLPSLHQALLALTWQPLLKKQLPLQSLASFNSWMALLLLLNRHCLLMAHFRYRQGELVPLYVMQDFAATKQSSFASDATQQQQAFCTCVIC